MPSHRRDILPADAAPRRGLPQPTRRFVLLAVVGTVVGALLVGTLVASARARASSRVLLLVDGTPTSVVSDAATVGDLLHEQGISVSGRDLVVPAPGTPLVDAADVRVSFARQVRLVVNGSTRTVWSTASDVAGLLAANNLPADSWTSVGPLTPLPRTGAAVTVRTPKTVAVQVDGQTIPLRTTAPTVRQALDVPAVGLQPSDLLSVNGDAAVVAGATYRVTRVEQTDEVRRHAISAATRWVRRSDLPTGTSQVVTTGRDGVRVRRVQVRYENGVAVKRHVVSDRLVRPVSWVIAVGTGPTSRSNVKITYQKNWTPATGRVNGTPDFAALAKCESGGNPRAVNPSGKYRGLYQFDLTTWHGVGGVGDPIDATPAEQTKRAQLLYNDRGRSPWPYCGRFL